MRTLVRIIVCVISISFTVCGCKRDDKWVDTKPACMKEKDELQATWQKLETKVNENPALLQDIQAILKSQVKGDTPNSRIEAVQQLYGLIKDPNANASDANQALKVFVNLKATEVIRESLLNPRKGVSSWGLVITASQALGDMKDENAIQHLIYVLDKNNYPQAGSEAATIHMIMKRKLVHAISVIASLDIEPGEIDLASKDQVEDFLSKARTWAMKKDMKPYAE